MSNVFVIIKMCYVHNQWYDISCATLYICLQCHCARSGNEHSDIANKYNSSLKMTRESKHLAINYKYNCC